MSAPLPPGAFSAGPYANGIRCRACNDGFHALPNVYFRKKPGDENSPSLICQNCGSKQWVLNATGRRLNVRIWWHPLTWFAKRSWQWIEEPPPPPPPPPPKADPEPPEPDPDPTASLPVNTPEWLKA